jgi:D-alanine--poly(phosphoribitol) ligase subunit 1
MQINVLELFENGALARCRQKVAVVDEDRRYTYEDIERFAKNCAALILRRSTTFNQTIAVFLPKSIQTIVADLGILYSGNCYANLDPKSPPERLKAMLQNLGSTTIITSATHAGVLRALGLPEDQLLLAEQAMTAETAYDNARLLARLDRMIDTDPLCVIHTSGSTGLAKGVALSHRSTIDYVDWAFARLGLDGSEVIGSLSPAFFDIYTLELNLCLAKGATFVIIPSHYAAFPAKLVEFLDARRITFIFWVPTMLINVATQNLLAGRKLDALKKVMFGGEVFPTKHLNYWRRHVPGATFINNYGPTEITTQCTYYIVDREFSDDEKIPLGFPCRNTDILILNSQDEPAQGEEPGELCIRGSSLGLGYWNNPEGTASAFTQNPLNPHYPELIYRTGDLGYKNNRGELMFAGRKDFQIKHFGYRIELSEIEHAALQVNGIRNCSAVYHHGRKEIILFFESDQELTPAVIRERLGAFLPKYMLPTVFHRMEQLPKTPNGKIDRQALTAGLA